MKIVSKDGKMALVRKQYFLTSGQSERFDSLWIKGRGRQISCTESFFNLFLKYFLNISN
jgi:hypothetical protein